MTGKQPEFRLPFNPNESETNYAWSYALCERAVRREEPRVLGNRGICECIFYFAWQNEEATIVSGYNELKLHQAGDKLDWGIRFYFCRLFIFIEVKRAIIKCFNR